MSYLFVVLSIVQIGWFCLCKQMTSFKKIIKKQARFLHGGTVHTYCVSYCGLAF